jgi:hypothetical protein
MSAPFIQITELPVIDGHIDHAQAAWTDVQQPSDVRRLYRKLDQSALLEVAASATWPDLAASAAERDALWEKVGVHAAGDFRREILRYVEEPKPTSGPLPDGQYLELRYVEVKPPVYEEYRAWRDRTIFDVVRESEQVKTFSAYHTAFTTRPGVVFLSAFDGDVDAYRGVFSSPRYRQIVQEAGDNYITGGNHGLATRVYVRATSDEP